MNFERFYDWKLLLALYALFLFSVVCLMVIEALKTPAEVEAVASEFLLERGTNFSNLSCKRNTEKIRGIWACGGGICMPFYLEGHPPVGYWRCNFSESATTEEIFCSADFLFKGCLEKTRKA